MDILFILISLICFAIFGIINYRYNCQKAHDLVEDFKRFNRQ